MKENNTVINQHKLFAVLSAANNILLSIDEEETAIKETLKILCEYSGGDRAYLFKNYFDVEVKKDYCSHLFEYHSAFVKPQANDPLLKKFFYENQKMSWLLDLLSSGQSIRSNIDDFPVDNQELLALHQLKSTLLQPIFIKNSFWGFVGIDSCTEYRVWQDDLNILVENIGAGLATYYDKFELNKQISRQREFYKTILEHSKEGISVLNNEGKIIYQSPSNAQVLGYSDEEIRNHNFFDFIHPEDLESAHQLYSEIYAAPGKFLMTEIRYRQNDGSYINLELEIINLLHEDTIGGMVVNFRDITESENQKKLLLRNQSMLNTAQSIAKIGSYEINLIEDSIQVSDELFEIHGVKREDITNMNEYYLELMQFVHPEDLERISLETEEGIATGKGYKVEYRIITNDKELKYLKSKATVEFTEQLKLKKIVGTTQDITESKKREELIQEISDNLKKKNQEFETFAYVTSHNLRSPLSNLKGLCSILDEEGISEPNKLIIKKIKPLLDQLDSSLIEIEKSISSINNTSRKFTDLGFKQVFNEVALELEHIISSSEAEIDTDFNSVSHITYPKSHLLNIFHNMISNAIKYQKPGRKPKLYIKTKRLGNEIDIDFKDNGLGIDLVKHKKDLFNMCCRFHKDYNIEGKGLGLYIVKEQVEQLNGTIKVESKVDKGTTFTIKLIEQKEELC